MYNEGNLRYAMFDKMKTEEDIIDELKLKTLSKKVGIETDELRSFVKGTQNNVGEIQLRELCKYLQIDIDNIHPGYFID